MDSQLLLQQHACLPATMLPIMMFMDSLSETVNKSPNKCLPLYIILVMMSMYSSITVTRAASFFFVGDRKREDGLLVHYPGVSLQPKPSTLKILDLIDKHREITTPIGPELKQRRTAPGKNIQNYE